MKYGITNSSLNHDISGLYLKVGENPAPFTQTERGASSKLE